MADEEPEVVNTVPMMRTAGALVTAILVGDRDLLVDLLSDLTHKELLGVAFFLAGGVADGVCVISEFSGTEPLETWRHALLMTEQEML